MLQRVIKRDGSIQPADINKAIGWVHWAGQGLGERVDLVGAIRYVFSNLGEEEKTSTINLQLREYLISKGTSPNLLAAGRLMMADWRKTIFPNGIPTVRAQVEHMHAIGLMESPAYTYSDFDFIEEVIQHDRDFMLDSSQVQQILFKYGLKNTVTKTYYETPQFTFMRKAMAIAAMEPNRDLRLPLLRDLYNQYSLSYLSSPTPSYNNLGTYNRGLASCCVIASEDTVPSLAAGVYAQYVMTCQSAGIGHLLMTRSQNDLVRNGAIMHKGKLPYINCNTGVVKANTQGSRGGASTEYTMIFDPEIKKLIRLQNPRTPTDQQNRDIHFSYQVNRVFTEKVIADEEIALFNIYTQPGLTALFYSPYIDEFRAEYEKFCASDAPKTWVRARELILTLLEEACAAGTVYLNFVDEMNRHTPLKDTIHTSNLCGEAMLNSKPYKDVLGLFKEEDHGEGEIGLCSLGAINLVKAHYLDDAAYERLYYLAVLAADTTIDISDYPLPHLGYTAKRRRFIGIGVMGLATLMAQQGLKYDSTEGKAFQHRLAERHMYFLIKASLKLSKERGKAEWMHKTRWPEGWLPIDTYAPAVDSITPHVLHYDWEELREEIIDNRGLRNSLLCNFMPGESSSKALGVPNSLYKIRQLRMLKSDGDQVLEWAAPDDDLLGDAYEIAWDGGRAAMVDSYAIWQKLCDQGISADYHDDRSQSLTLYDDNLLHWYLRLEETGQKSVYYINSKTSGGQVKIEENCGSNCKS